VAGVALADQMKSLDWRARDVTRIAALPDEIVNEILARASLLIKVG
jgi:mRNA-degrading endonuclease toxin of MazEF toxin-antitoxin module